MDKNKSRTDLLAAGRKKLQQFRQKKDGKGSGSQGKSSKKSGKSEQREADADVELAASPGNSDAPIVATSSSLTSENVADNTDVAVDDSSAVASRQESSAVELVVDDESSAPRAEVGEPNVDSVVNYEGTSTGTIDAELERTVPSVGSDAMNSEEDSKYENTSVSIDLPSQPLLVASAGEGVTVESQSLGFAENSLPLREDIPDTSLTQARADQVTDLGAMQEADGLDGRQSNHNSEIELEGDNKIPLFELDKSTEASSGLSLAETGMSTSRETEPSEKVDEVSISDSAKFSDGCSGTALASDEAEISSVSPAVAKHESMGSSLPSLYEGNAEQKNEVKIVARDGGVAEGYNQQHMLDSYGKPLKTYTATSDLSLADLSQLINLIKGLSDEEFGHVLKSREPVSSAEPDNGSRNLLERLKEELFLTNFTKDICQLQLAQQSELQGEFDHDRHRLVDEIALLRTSLKEYSEKNQCLAEELSGCRFELQAAVSAREELEIEFRSSQADVEELSARANELQMSLEKSQGELLSLTSELANCKKLMTTLQVENENLNGTIALATDERNKIDQEKDFHLGEIEKLLKELADSKTSVAALQSETSNLTTSLSSLTAERNLLEEEMENLRLEHEKLSTEFDDCKGLASALQLENSRLKESIDLVTEERKKIEEDKNYFALENERLSSELVIFQEKISNEQRERERVEVDLSEMSMRLEQVIEENIFLSSSLEVHKAKLMKADSSRLEMPLQSTEVVNQVEISEVLIGDRGCTTAVEDFCSDPGKQVDEVGSSFVEKSLSDGHAGQTLHEREVLDDFVDFESLKERLEEAEKILYQLEKASEGVQTYSLSFSKPGGKLAAPGVSKLIQAFESKVHTDEHEAEESPSAEYQSTTTDPFVLMKEETRNLKALFKQLVVDASNACVLFKSEHNGRRTDDTALGELKDQYEALKEHSSSLEATNIELSVLCEVVKQHGSRIEAANNELVALYESTMQDVTCLKAENTQLASKLCSYESRSGELQTKLYNIRQGSNEMAAVIGNRMEDLQKEVSQRILTLEQEWSYTLAQVVEIVQKLAESAGKVGSPVSVPENDGLDVVSHVAASVNATTKVIEDLQKKLEDAQTGHGVISTMLKEVNQRCDDLHQKNDLAVGTLQKIHGHLVKLVPLHGSADESETDIENEKLPDPLDYSNYGTIMGQLEHYLSERRELESVSERLNFELKTGRAEFEELKRGCLSADVVCKLIESVEAVLEREDTKVELDKLPAARFESLVSILVQKYEEAHEQLSFSKKEFGSTVTRSTELQEEIQQLTSVCLQHEAEIVVLKKSLSQAEEALVAAGSELEKKASELEQSEQRVSSIREKLGIAVSKGKGLVVQRDGLKQSLAETSSELERCLQELQTKDARLHEIETKLNVYSEAGERAEALESELSYIRNSATGLRESFLLKDSVLQRIEEILEDLDLPEHFHSKDILEKVEWLARSAASNILPAADWDQKSSAGGGSYSESGFVTMEPWKEDVQSSSNPGEDMKRKYEELQSKFYGLAEQNEMLEQSLMERNNLVQKWEELLDRIDMPTQLRSMEPEDRIQWLGRAVLEAHHETISLQEKVINFENYCGSLNADLEESQGRILDLESNLEAVTRERGYLSERMEILSQDYDKILAKVTEYEVENRKLQSEVISLEENHEKLSAKKAEVESENRRLQNEAANLQENVAEMLRNRDHILRIEGEVRRLQSLVIDVLQDPGIQEQVSTESSVEGLEVLLRKLLENYVNFSSEKPVVGDVIDGLENDVTMTEEVKSRSIPDGGDSDIAILKKELDEALNELIHVKEERDTYEEKQHSLASEIEALDKRKEELELLLNQEEQKSASVREKLKVAVNKGKLVVQQRDSLKQTIETMNTEVEKLKSEVNSRENKLSEYEKKFRELATFPERVEALESEILLLRNRLTDTEQHFQETGHTLSMILNNLADVHVGNEVDSTDPVKKSEQIVRFFRDLHANLVSSEEESRKSKRAAELLLAELNEVQERNDNLQDELANAAIELSELTKERDVAESAKLEAHSRLEELYNAHSVEQRDQFAELKGLKSSVDQLKKGFRDVSSLIADVSSKDLEFLRNLENGISLCLNPTSSTDVISVPSFNASLGFRSSSSDNKGLFASFDSWLDSNMHSDFDGNSVTEVCSSVGRQVQQLMTEVGALKEKLYNHSNIIVEQASSLSKSMAIAQRELMSRNELHEAMKRDIEDIESSRKENEKELVILHKSIALLFEALSGSIAEIENTKAELLGNNLAAGDLGMNMKSAVFPDGGLSSPSEESIKSIAHKLLFAVRDFAGVKAEIMEGSLKQMKIAIADLQKELQEKEVQKERICMDLVSQIKTAEAAAARYSVDLQSSRSRVGDLEKQLEEAERARNLFEQKVRELQDARTTSTELQQRVRSLTDVIAAKDQEIESLMQALDEEESQMEDHTRKIGELEKVLQQKNLDLENVEASRGKVAKKLAITVSKFDELHQLSASLLAEVEKLQSQLQERDAEISFLRQEVTRCTNDVLVASQISNKRDSDEIHEFLTWFDLMTADVGVHNVHSDVKNGDQVQEHKELLKKKIESVLSELVDLREVAQSKDTLLQVERSKVDALTRKEEILERSLRDKDLRLNLLEGVGTSRVATGTTSEIMEVEPVINKWTVPGPSVTSQVRSLRKGNNDQVAIAIDMDPGSSNRLEDEDDDKVHGFKSLTTSRIVPRFTRPVTDMVDGLWVSCDRALMRQPALRLGIIIYWAVLHALLASIAI